MAVKQKKTGYIYRKKAALRRRHRLLFPSPAEVEFIRVMGGKVMVLDLVKEPIHGYPLCIVLSLGDLLKREKFKREVRVGAFFIDFGNDILRGIEVDWRPFHGDIVREQSRDQYCSEYGWMLLHVTGNDLYTRPEYVRSRVQRFIEK